MAHILIACLSALAVIGMPSRASALTFAASTGSPFTVGTTPISVALGDVNADGKPDLATANASSNDVTVLLGNGSGSFTPATGSPFAAGTTPFSVALGDVNADGKPDLATANGNSNDVTILLGNGSGGFTPAAGSPFGVGTNPRSVAFGYVNADGKLDLATANISSNDVTVLLGNGAGGFSPAAGSPFAGGSSPVSVALGDVNADGKTDLATANGNSNDVTVLLGNGSGGFTPAAGSPFSVGTSPQSVALGDVNADGQLDLATANFDSNNVTVLLGNGSGGFTPATGSPFAAGTGSPVSVGLGDVNADGKPDLATAKFNSNNVTVLLGNGSGGFTPAAGSPFSVGTSPQSVALGDVNADGQLDLATANPNSNNVTVLLNTSVRKATPSTPSAFASQTVGTLSAPKVVTVTSGTGLATHVAKVNTSGTDADDFVITSDHCTGETLGDGYASSCTVGVRFLPSATGARSATLDVISDSPASPETAALSGTGAPGGGPDTDPPETTITDHPPELTNNAQPTFRFTADEPSTFGCRFDAELFDDCSSPFSALIDLSEGVHSFDVKATDTALNPDTSPDSFSFTVDTVGPTTTITGPTKTTKRKVKFKLAFSEEIVSARCKVDGATYKPCTDPYITPRLMPGNHTVFVKAVDEAGNKESPAASFNFKVKSS